MFGYFGRLLKRSSGTTGTQQYAVDRCRGVIQPGVEDTPQELYRRYVQEGRSIEDMPVMVRLEMCDILLGEAECYAQARMVFRGYFPEVVTAAAIREDREMKLPKNDGDSRRKW